MTAAATRTDALPAAPAARPEGIARLHLTLVAALTAVTALASHHLANRHAPPRVHGALDWLIGGWLRWDSWWYVNIAAHGYSYRPHHMSSVAFFPVYPLVVRFVAAVTPAGDALAAVAITITCGLLALHLLHRWSAHRLTPAAARGAVVVLALYPFAWFLYGAAYSDALFLCLVLGAFLLLEADRPGWATLVGAVATAARPTGITLAVGLIAVALDRRGWLGGRPRLPLRRRELVLAGSVAGLVAWCTFLALRFGNPLAFVETEGAPGWNQPPGPHTWFKLSFVRALERVPPVEAVALLVQVAAVVAFLAAVPAVARRFGRGYGVYVAAVVLMPAICSADFLGLGRYVLPAFPVFALVAERLQGRRLLRTGVLALSGAGLVLGAGLYAAGYLIA